MRYFEMDKQNELFEQVKNEAETIEQIATMNIEQVTALSKILENTIR